MGDWPSTPEPGAAQDEPPQTKTSNTAATPKPAKVTDNRKVIKLRYSKEYTASLQVGRDRALIAGDDVNFIQASQDGVHISVGAGKPITLQTISAKKPFVREMFFPFTLFGSMASFPKEIIDPPFKEVLPFIPPMLQLVIAMGAVTAAAAATNAAIG
jgi:hypothetical protein